MNWIANIFGPNWRTLLAGLFTAVMVGLYDANVNGTLHKTTIGVIIGTAVIAYFAKDKQVTGGQIPNMKPKERLHNLAINSPATATTHYGGAAPIHPPADQERTYRREDRGHMRRRDAAALLILLLLALAPLTGCPQDKYKRAAIAGRDFAISVRAIQQTEMALACRPIPPATTAPAGCQAVITPAQHLQWQAAFERTAQAGLEVDKVIRTGAHATDKDVEAMVNEALDATQRLLETANIITDARAKAAVLAAVITARGILTNVQLTLRSGQ